MEAKWAAKEQEEAFFDLMGQFMVKCTMICSLTDGSKEFVVYCDAFRIPRIWLLYSCKRGNGNQYESRQTEDPNEEEVLQHHEHRIGSN
ncbi:hypothetical protein Tco_0893149 [Tanacetum coccineum]|uniref:Uncharacterized protein n=1 Tax=Tanacetum coccineum TaxID=301880 RepID=A0ABQ5C9L7_9ASTR